MKQMRAGKMYKIALVGTHLSSNYMVPGRFSGATSHSAQNETTSPFELRNCVNYWGFLRGPAEWRFMNIMPLPQGPRAEMARGRTTSWRQAARPRRWRAEPEGACTAARPAAPPRGSSARSRGGAKGSGAAGSARWKGRGGVHEGGGALRAPPRSRRLRVRAAEPSPACPAFLQGAGAVLKSGAGRRGRRPAMYRRAPRSHARALAKRRSLCSSRATLPL